MRSSVWNCRSVLLIACLVAVATRGLAEDELPPQYEFGEIRIPGMSADEPKREKVSVELASTYLDQGSLAWKGSRKCVTCHTTGIYMTVRPALAARLGKPLDEMRDFFVDTLKAKRAAPREELRKSINPAQVIYLAAGLAEWDAHLAKAVSQETRDALSLMMELQLDNGSWGSLDCWPPYESDAYHLATVAAMAVATAPNWLNDQQDAEMKERIARLKNYLKTEAPPHDYGRVLLLWTATRMPDLLTDEQKQAAIEMIAKHQRPDGGWSMRTFASPEAWGSGNRAGKLKGEPEFDNPPSDGHQTGLAIIVLRDAGVAASDERIQRGVAWLLSNQRSSGRWWTRSLNTDTYHFIAYSGTAFPLLALEKCKALPEAGQGG